MAGIYIHIPFCKQACHYCNFHFSTSLKLQNDLIAALLEEITLQRNYLNTQTINTIYFGGGTPSLLEKEELVAIFSSLRSHFSIADDAEITLEANPDDLSPEKLSDWKTIGINRLSIGIQSFFDEDLRWMNRAHTAGQALDCISMARAAGIDNFSIDLIYGGPTLSDEHWQHNLETAVNAQIPHLSCYALTVEPGTALQIMTQKKKVQEVTPEHQARHFQMMVKFLQAQGYEQYEISNFALPGMRSRHNSSYWSGEWYLGIGPSAHSFNGESRQWNIANNALYIQSLKNQVVPFEIEWLTPVQRLNEYVMTSLRTIQGTDLEHIAKIFGESYRVHLLEASKSFLEKGWLNNSSGKLILTNEGKLFADGIAAGLFSDEPQTNTDSIFLKASRG